MHIPIKKLGTIDEDIVETTPVVFNGALHRFEYIRERYKGNRTGKSFFRFIDVKSGKSSAPFGAGFHLGSAFVWQNEMFVFAVGEWGGNAIYMFRSSDMKNWSDPAPVLSDPEMAAYNTSVCRGDGKFIMAYELGKPEKRVGEPFTVFFAETENVERWRESESAPPYSPERYTACPTIRYANGFYYLFVLEGSYETRFCQHLVRSRDLKRWESSPYNPVLAHSDEDRLGAEKFAGAASAVNINNSDIDLCGHDGKIFIYYSWGNQRGSEFLAEARAEGDLGKFLESYFE